jgi:hypothetical protein
VRFKHQSHELSVPIPDGPINAATVSAAEEGFRNLYNELYGVLPNDPRQVVNFRVRATGIVPKTDPAPRLFNWLTVGQASSLSFPAFPVPVAWEGRSARRRMWCLKCTRTLTRPSHN